MKRFYKIFNSLLLIILLSLFGCGEEPTPSLFNSVPTGPIGATPVITSITPSDSARAGVDLLTIAGSNFSSDINRNFVFFNGRSVQVISASTTSLVVKAPKLLSDTARFEVGKFKVSTLDAELYSNEVQYKLKPVIFQFFKFTQFQKPYSFVIDASKNIFISMTNDLGVGIGVKKLTPSGQLLDYAPKGSETYWTAMRFGPGGILITVRQDNVRALFQIPAGGGTPSTYVVLPNNSAKIASIDFDANNNLWVGGNNTAIYKVKPDKSITSYNFTGNITALRFYNGNLYAIVKTDSGTLIQSFPIDANGDLGNPSLYFDFSKSYGSQNVNAIEFSSDGDMFLATSDVKNPIIIVHADKTSETLFPGVLAASPALFLGWGSDGYLYYTRAQGTNPSTGEQISQSILRLTIQKQGAPYYGQ
ncbi:IPT/TIG domain-containing protein [Melioribacteraceae bacterium 4301-Me]|uniref:IPT/TIG domain-containing protein n=1 Tax=Pyranulibacter aquaticus TaxID=3163344 RepID=UPI0035979856